MSLLSHRRALVLAGLTGMLLAGGTLATATAAQADDTSPNPDDTKIAPIPGATLDIAEAADKAEAKYPDCETTAALLYDTASSPVWDVELTCTSGTVKYVTVDGDTGTVADNGSTTDDTSDSTKTDKPDNTSDSTKSDKSDDTNSTKKNPSDDTGSAKKNPSDDTSSSSNSGDAPGTGKNADYN